MLVPLQYNDLLAKGDILCGQVGYDIKPPVEAPTVDFDEPNHYLILHTEACKFNTIKTYE